MSSKEFHWNYDLPSTIVQIIVWDECKLVSKKEAKELTSETITDHAIVFRGHIIAWGTYHHCTKVLKDHGVIVPPDVIQEKSESRKYLETCMLLGLIFNERMGL